MSANYTYQVDGEMSEELAAETAAMLAEEYGSCCRLDITIRPCTGLACEVDDPVHGKCAHAVIEHTNECRVSIQRSVQQAAMEGLN